MTLEILKSMAKEGQVFSISQLFQKTHIKKEVRKVILSRMENRGIRSRGGNFFLCSMMRLIILYGSFSGYFFQSFVQLSLP